MSDTEFFPFILTLEAPVIASSLERDANSARSLPYLPGSMLRGAVARALGDPDRNEERRARFEELVLSGQVCYLNAYPTSASGRALPTPAGLRMEKYGDRFHDLSGSRPQERGSGGAGLSEPSPQLLRIPEPYVTLGAAGLRRVAVQMTGTVHHQRVRELGRATAERGAMFYYEAIAAGQELEGLLAIRGNSREERLSRQRAVGGAMGETLWLGRSRRAEYGGSARITWRPARPRETQGCEGLVNADLEAGKIFRMLLSSDYLGRDARSGQMDPTWLLEEIVARLGGERRARVVQRLWDFRPVGAFNRKWGLELPQVLALRAGSVLVLEALAPVSMSELAAVEQSGLGERRGEGFGRVLFLAEGRSPISIQGAAGADRPQKPPDVRPGPTVRSMERRLLERGLEGQVLRRADHAVQGALRKHPEKIPPSSLLGRLRTPLRAGPAGLATLREWLEPKGPHELRQTARESLEGCGGIGGGNLLCWLRQILAAEDEEIARQLDFEKLAEERHIVSATNAGGHLRELVAQARWQLVDSVLGLLSRQVRRRSREASHGQ